MKNDVVPFTDVRVPIHEIDQEWRTAMLDHCIRTVANAPLETDPFPHFVVSGFLPNDTYTKILATLPGSDAYESFGYRKHHNKDGMGNRFRYSLLNKNLASRLPHERRLWYTLRSVLVSSELKQVVYQKLAPGLTMRYGIDVPYVKDLSGYALPELFRETEGYSIKPHPDTRKKVVTMQLALAEDESLRELGTEFYRLSLHPRTWLRPPYGFDTVKTLPFLPNTCYAFSVLNIRKLKSWHGRSKIPSELGIRNSLLNIWYEKPVTPQQELIDDTAWYSSPTNQRKAA
ncbi:MAG: hypothetical protein O2955_06430 [Planctomycetota bacterium]|nr:hypothetical protein [Planctomycetota bacterium]MDA1212130.1 hypothetical protein [Planctomycetota bacterium]